MLLRPPRTDRVPVDESTEAAATDPSGPGTFDAQPGAGTAAQDEVAAVQAPDCRNNQEQAAAVPAPWEAWIMYGPAAASLFQAGVCLALADHGRLPRSLYAGGFSTLNAVLLASGGRRALDRGWELLRSRRLLFNQALREMPFLRRFATRTRGIGWMLARQRAYTATAATPIALHLGSRTVCLRSVGVPSDARKLQRFTESALREESTDPRTWRKAIDSAIAEGATQIVLLGFDRNIDADLPEAAAASAQAAGAELACIALRTTHRARPIDFLLPGSGVPERLMADGKRAANEWLRNGRPGVVAGVAAGRPKSEGSQ